MAETKPKIHSYSIGRRKSAVASVRLISGSGEVFVNSQPAAKYFPGLVAKTRLHSPFEALKSTKYNASVKVAGGGPNGQLEATILGLARSLSTLSNGNKIILRQANLLTRDSRERQRRMIGTGGKSRRRKQSPKR
jgi:small subunit ribosomal protein S9